MKISFTYGVHDLTSNVTVIDVMEYNTVHSNIHGVQEV